MKATFSVIFKTLLDSTVYQSFGDKRDLALLQPGFQQVSHSESGLFSKRAWQSHLELILDLDDRHRGSQESWKLQLQIVRWALSDIKGPGSLANTPFQQRN